MRLVAANDRGFVDGEGPVLTIYDAAPRDAYPMSLTNRLSGIHVATATVVRVVDACQGFMLELERQTSTSP